jgi:hypothetical protein
MNIDKNQIECDAMEAFKEGNRVLGHKLQDQFVKLVRESLDTEDHCNCTNRSCKYHGKCLECVAIHRAHQDHLPYCMQDMLNQKIRDLSALTEDSAF